MIDPFTGALIIGGLSGAISLFGSTQKRKDERRAYQAAVDEANRARWEAIQREDEAKMAHELATIEARKSVERSNVEARASVESHNEAVKATGEKFIQAPHVAMDRFLSDASAAGINPLTYLRSGALSAYSKSVDAPGYQLQTPATFAPATFTPSAFIGGSLPGLPTANLSSSASGFASALSDGFGSFVSQYRIGQQQQFQTDLLQKQLDGITAARAAGSNKSGSFNVPAGTTMGGTVKRGGGELGAVAKPEVGKVEVTNPFGWAKVDPTARNAEASEARYGDDGPMSWIMGAARGLDDLWYNATGTTAAQRRAVTLGAWDAFKTDVKGVPAAVREFTGGGVVNAFPAFAMPQPGFLRPYVR